MLLQKVQDRNLLGGDLILISITSQSLKLLDSVLVFCCFSKSQDVLVMLVEPSVKYRMHIPSLLLAETARHMR